MMSRGYLSLFAACFFWAISFVASKIALEQLPPVIVVFLRTLIATACYLLWFGMSGRLKSFAHACYKPGMQCFLWGIALLNACHYLSQTIGLNYTSAANASLYVNSGPILIFMISAIFLNEKLTLRKTCGVIVATSGVILVLGLDTLLSMQLKDNLVGDLLVLVSILFWAIVTVWSKKYVTRLSTLDMSTAMTVLSLPLLFLMALPGPQGVSLSLLSAVSLEGWLAVIFLGVTCSFLAVLLYIRALEHVDSQVAGIFLYTVPPMTYVTAALYLNEPITATLIVGTLLVTFGVWLTSQRR